jgi:hypothetical protein
MGAETSQGRFVGSECEETPAGGLGEHGNQRELAGIKFGVN